MLTALTTAPRGLRSSCATVARNSSLAPFAASPSRRGAEAQDPLVVEQEDAGSMRAGGRHHRVDGGLVHRTRPVGVGDAIREPGEETGVDHPEFKEYRRGS